MILSLQLRPYYTTDLCTDRVVSGCLRTLSQITQPSQTSLSLVKRYAFWMGEVDRIKYSFRLLLSQALFSKPQLTQLLRAAPRSTSQANVRIGTPSTPPVPIALSSICHANDLHLQPASQLTPKPTAQRTHYPKPRHQRNHHRPSFDRAHPSRPQQPKMPASTPPRYVAATSTATITVTTETGETRKRVVLRQYYREFRSAFGKISTAARGKKNKKGH